jgi:hypothetical protein
MTVQYLSTSTVATSKISFGLKNFNNPRSASDVNGISVMVQESNSGVKALTTNGSITGLTPRAMTSAALNPQNTVIGATGVKLRVTFTTGSGS